MIQLSSIEALRRELQMLGPRVEAEVVKAMRKSARFGVTANIRQSAMTKPRPKASGTYEAAFVATDIRDGSVVSNTARHARFVEAGRRPGKMPPFAPILEWAKQKKLFGLGRSFRSKRPETNRARMRRLGREVAAQQRAARPRRSESGRARGRRIAREVAAQQRTDGKTAKAFAGLGAVARVAHIVNLIRRKIALRGVRARPVTKMTLPTIAGHSQREIRMAFRLLSKELERKQR